MSHGIIISIHGIKTEVAQNIPIWTPEGSIDVGSRWLFAFLMKRKCKSNMSWSQVNDANFRKNYTANMPLLAHRYIL